MKNIRSFIVCSSMVLVGWLTASYTSELESTEDAAAASTSAQPAAESTLAGAEQKQVLSTASVAGIR